MRKFVANIRDKYQTFFWYDFYYHLWFSYHHVFFGSLIFRGKKILAFNNFLKIKFELKIREKYDPFLVFLVSMMRITPSLILKPVKKSGISYGVPFPVSHRKQVTFAIKWVLKLLRDSNRIAKISRIVELLVSAIYNKGLSIRKKIGLYKVALRNRPFIKFFR